jgi:anti-sigma B factor antagonist
MKIKRKPRGQVMVLALSRPVTGGPDCAKFQTEVKSLIHDGYRDIILDFGGVAWISSNGVGLIICAYTTLQKHGGRMRICRLNDRNLSLLYVTQLYRVFPVHDTVAEAVAACEPEPYAPQPFAATAAGRPGEQPPAA